MICGESCGVQDTKSNSMRNKVLGGTPYFFALFPGWESFKRLPSSWDIADSY